MVLKMGWAICLVYLLPIIDLTDLQVICIHSVHSGINIPRSLERIEECSKCS
ncbi:hypothetical protein M758_UG038700 [Ceratodon purpureus]|nr:hypothetical protein M758_UG038700 [Ceratodon purpureus]